MEPMVWVISLAVWVGLGLITRYISKEKGRSPGGGFCWGFFLGIIGLIVVACLPSKK